jgi:hypothetical protein
MKIWIDDPIKKLPSVSLTLMVIATILFVGLGLLDVLGKIKGIGVFSEFLYTTFALYFGRRLDFNKFISKRK